MGYKNGIKYDRAKGVYRVKIVRQGKPYKKTLRTRKNAEAWIANLEAKLLGLPLDQPPPTISAAMRSHQRKLTLRVDAVSKSAKQKVEAAGGTVELLPRKEPRGKFVKKTPAAPSPSES